jgi:D-alanine transaminase
VEDFRWGRCDIKTTALLANVLMRQRAADADAQEAILVRDGDVLEGSATSVFVVSKGVIATPPNSSRILPGTTRDVALELADAAMPVTVRRIGIDELRAADEVWISAATRNVMPLTQIDGRPVGTGKPGPLWQRMNESFKALRERLAGTPAL